MSECYNNISKELKTITNLMKRAAFNYIQKTQIDGSIELENCFDKKCKPTAVQGLILRYLVNQDENKNIFQKDIEKEFSIRRSTATEILKIMERNGYITKVNVPEDARLKKIVLTKKAIEEHNRAIAGIKEIEDIMLKGIDEKELEVVLDVIKKMKFNLENY